MTVLFTKFGGPLTKRISLAPDGSLKSDGSACVMAHGRAQRVAIKSVADLGALIEREHEESERDEATGQSVQSFSPVIFSSASRNEA